jgi:hypothetical protein
VDHRAAHAEQAIANTAAGASRRLCEVIEAGQRDGVFRRRSPALHGDLVIAQVAYFAIARPAVGLLLGWDAVRRARYPTSSTAEEFALAALMEGRSA